MSIWRTVQSKTLLVVIIMWFQASADCVHFLGIFLNTFLHLGKTWLKFLATCKPRSAARDFLVKLVTTEIKNYLKYVYQVKSQREPENFGSLPTHSIVRALGEFVKRNFLRNSTENEALFVDCMAILSAKYPKPLPPQDWCFLQELLHVPSLKEYCLNLASRQAILSGSARRLMENYIVAATQATFAVTPLF